MASLGSDTVLARVEDVNATQVGGKTVLFSARAGAFLSLNRIGGDIWDMLVEPRRVGELVEGLSRRYHVAGEFVTRDVAPFLQTLLDHRVLRVVGPEGTR
jgi:hypothetical protein